MTKIKKEIIEIKSIPVIEKFLNQWRIKAESYYVKLKVDYLNLYNAKYTINEEDFIKYLEQPKKQVNKISCTYSELNKWDIERLVSYKKNQIIDNFLMKLSGNEVDLLKYHVFLNYEEKIKILLDREVSIKRNTLIIRIEEKVGIIQDVKGLNVGVNGELNGYIIGSLGNAKVNTIYAGGKNIQCLHYRVLVK